MRFFIRLAYKGTQYCGWQRQPNAPSVQETIEQGLSKILGTDTEIIGCGRTDTGVHASDFYAHFDYPDSLDCDKITHALNKILPFDISIYAVFPVDEELHARFSAIKRTYTYTICRHKNPFMTDTALLYTYKLDVERMNTAAHILLRYTDFTSFSKLHTDVSSHNCTIYKALWEEKDDCLVFTIEANRFLRNMVRAITGTILDVGRGKISIEAFTEIIEAKNRQEAGQSIAAHGLCLVGVHYPEQLTSQ